MAAGCAGGVRHVSEMRERATVVEVVEAVDVVGDGLRREAGAWAAVALANIDREYPYAVLQTVHGPGELPARPRDRTPVFFGSFDWHSCVEMHWILVRLLRLVPDAVPAQVIRARLDETFTAAGAAAEAAFVTSPDTGVYERPYGWGWALQLTAELARWDDPDARRWTAALAPLDRALESALLAWLPSLTYPVRHGVHANSAFGVSLALDRADQLAAGGRGELRAGLEAAADRWFGADTDAPARFEPSGNDFLSPSLVEAELVGRLHPASFAPWLQAFLPGLASREPVELFTPAVVSDSTDGHLGHLHGLNLSRAWALRRVAALLPAGDPRVAVARAAAREHAAAALPHVVGGDYALEHWLAAYALLLATVD